MDNFDRAKLNVLIQDAIYRHNTYIRGFYPPKYSEHLLFSFSVEELLDPIDVDYENFEKCMEAIHYLYRSMNDKIVDLSGRCLSGLWNKILEHLIKTNQFKKYTLASIVMMTDDYYSLSRGSMV
jgi:hypothetical protein